MREKKERVRRKSEGKKERVRKSEEKKVAKKEIEGERV